MRAQGLLGRYLDVLLFDQLVEDSRAGLLLLPCGRGLLLEERQSHPFRRRSRTIA